MSRLNFDARWIGEHGIGRFAREVLSRIQPVNPVRGFIKPTNPLDLINLFFSMNFNSSDNWFSPGFNPVVSNFERYLFTIHDLNHIDVDGNGSFIKNLYYERVLKPAAKRAASVLTVSEFSRTRILEWCDAPEENVVNVGNGVSECFSPHGEIYKPGYEYFLCVSNRKPHKNEDRLLSSFAQCAFDDEIKLVFSGDPDTNIVASIKKLNLSNSVYFAGRLDEPDLASLYRGAQALVFPSLYEGFGLPLVEAMACGTPVITSNTTSLIEVADYASLLVDPLSEVEISAAMQTILMNKALRNDLSLKGLKRSAHFSWDKVAERVVSVINRVFPNTPVTSSDICSGSLT